MTALQLRNRLRDLATEGKIAGTLTAERQQQLLRLVWEHGKVDDERNWRDRAERAMIDEVMRLHPGKTS